MFAYPFLWFIWLSITILLVKRRLLLKRRYFGLHIRWLILWTSFTTLAIISLYLNFVTPDGMPPFPPADVGPSDRKLAWIIINTIVLGLPTIVVWSVFVSDSLIVNSVEKEAGYQVF
jgi:hypothetical protein